MHLGFRTIIPAVFLLVLSVPAPLLAEEHSETDFGYEDESDNFGESVGGASPPSSSPPATAASIVASLNAAAGYCSLVGASAYAIDCVAERLAKLSNDLKGAEGFEDVQAVLEKASKDLNKIARSNRSTTLPAARFTTTGATPVKTTRRLVPVDEANKKVAVAQALAVIAEAETLLLRSTAGSAGAVQYQRIASALGSNKVLLRSI